MQSSLADLYEGPTAWGSLGQETLTYFLELHGGLFLPNELRFIFKALDAALKVIFVFRGPDLTMKAGFGRGSSSGCESTDTHLLGPNVLDP